MEFFNLHNKNRILNLFGLAIFLILSGCNSTQQTQSTALPVFDTSAYQAMRVDARQLEVVENWKMPMAPPYIEHKLSPSLSSLLVDWASDVLVPVGGSGSIVLEITQASVKSSDLAKGEKLSDNFKDRQEAEIRADVKAKLIWTQPVGGQQATIELAAHSSVTVKESATPNERDMAAHDMMVAVVGMINAQAGKEMAGVAGILRP